MIAPTKRKEADGMTNPQIIAWLVEDPKRLRRPIIDTGEQVLLGFTRTTREALS